MKQQAKDLIKNTEPKVLGHAVKRDSLLWAAIQSATKHLPEKATIAERLWCYINDQDPYCNPHGNRKRFISITQGYGYCGMTKDCPCAKEAISKKVSDTKQAYSQERKDEIQSLRESTSLRVHGVKNNAQTDKAKAAHAEFYSDPVNVANAVAANIASLQAAYGPEVTNASHVPGSKENRRLTIYERYGVENVMSFPDIAKKAGDTRRGIPMSRDVFKASFDKIKTRFLEDYSLHFLMTFDEYTGVTNIGFVPLQCAVCSHKFDGRMYYGHTPICRSCHPVEHHYRSIPELEILEFVKDQLQIPNVRSGDRLLLRGTELDILSHEYKVAIEYGGLYWHCEKLGKHRDYHANKMIRCNELGYRLITIFADEWMFKRKIVESKLRNAFKKIDQIVGARKLTISEPSAYEHRTFLNENHLQGYVRASFVFVLKDDKDEILALMSFGNLRQAVNQNHIPDHYEMIRFAVKQGYSVPGAASRLFKAFIKQQDPISVVSYADLRWSEGNLYNTLGFVANDKATIGYSYTKDHLRRESRHNFTKAKLVEQGADPNLTEAEIMIQLGFNKIFDCGILKFTWRKYSNDK